MELQRTRIFLLVSLFAVGFALFTFWQQEHKALPEQETSAVNAASSQSDIPSVTTASVQHSSAATPATNELPLTKAGELIEIKTDTLSLKVDLNGGDIVRAELLKYPQTLNSEKGVVLLDRAKGKDYIAQSGLIGKDELGPDSHAHGRAQYTASAHQFQLEDNQDELKVNLHWQNQEGVKVVKTLSLKRGTYLVDVNYNIHNPKSTVWQGSFYGQLQREHVKEKSNGMFGVQMYQGGALYTPSKPFKKISFQDMQKSPFREEIQGGWAAQVEHYFLSAWVPDAQSTNTYYTRVDNDNVYNIGAVTPVEVQPNTSQSWEGRFYIGPEIADVLEKVSPGLNLTIDYGILWPISQLIFWLLKSIYGFVGNWGWSIILVTLVIKVLFYKLSAASYRSMGRMRLLQPRIELLKERHKDDKQQFSMALMDLYKKEKLNPLGGCLPILIQIPVFIALYYVLLESVELRHAPFMFWIKDLSSSDPYFVLPLIMGATMFLQQRLNPAPPDPVQAKVMMFMPVIFTALFITFPSGLVLYWTVNNILSIAQQWIITKQIEREGTALKKAK